MADTLITFTDQERLKSELQAARRRGALKSGGGGGGSSGGGGGGGGRSCARCRTELGRIINRGAFCRWCRHRVCKNCREYISDQTSDWVCSVCHKHMELTAASGDWMSQLVRRPSKRRESHIAAVETVKRTLQRSWTFSDASPSPWASPRNSPEMRAYSSMPRHQDCEYITPTFTKPASEPSDRKECEDTAKENIENSVPDETESKEVDDKPSDTVKSSESVETNHAESNGLVESIESNDLVEPNESNDLVEPIESNDVIESTDLIEEENTISVSATDNESSIGSPMVDKRSLSESTYQSSIGSPVIDNRHDHCQDSPIVSSGESPLVEKRTVSDAVIEPLTGTVFRKVTLKKRRVDTRNLPPGVTPPRSRRRPRDRAALGEPEEAPGVREDYRLVFISSSDSSSREELQSDDNSSTSSGLVGDWDYYEPGGGAHARAAGGEVVAVPQSAAAAATVPVPIPVPLPIPVPVLVPVPVPCWSPDLTIRVQHLWSMQQLVTVTLQDGPMSQRLSEDLRIAALRHLLGLPHAAPLAHAGIKTVDASTDTCDDDCDKVIEQSADCRPNVLEPEHCADAPLDRPLPDEYKPDDVPVEDKIVPNIVERNDRVVLDSKENCDDGVPIIGDLKIVDVEKVSDKSETDGVVLKTYKFLDVRDQEAEIDDLLKHKECAEDPAMRVDDFDTPSSTSSSDESDRDGERSRFYRFDREEESEDEDGDEDSSGEFSMASSLSSSPGCGKFKRVYVVNDSDSDLGELPECQDDHDSAHEEGEVTLLSHVNTAEPEAGDGPEADGFVDLRSVLRPAPADMVADSLEPEAPEAEHGARESPPLSADKTLVDDKSLTREPVSDDKPSFKLYDPKLETSEFLCREMAHCEEERAPGEAGGSTSDEFSGTESMELEQGQSRAAAAGPVAGESWRETGRYTSLVMITRQDGAVEAVNVVTSDTTTLVPCPDSEVRVVTGNGTTAVVILEEGLPDDDSWVEELDREELATTTEDSSEDDVCYVDREEELRGYNPRSAIDFTLHTIVEESCEESEVDERNRPTEFEKYFLFGVGDGNADSRETDTMSETSSVHSEGLESLGGYEDGENEGKDPAELASSRLEKYFLSGLLGCGRRDSDGSVGSDSEGKPSPEQRRKRLVRARGTGRPHSSSLDNLHESEAQDELQAETEGSSTETDEHDDLGNSFDKNDGQFDTVKRTKKKKRSVVSAPSLELLETAEDASNSAGRGEDSDDGDKTPQPEFLLPADPGSGRNKQQSRDSGFVGSCDDLLKENKEAPNGEASEAEAEKVPEKRAEEHVVPRVKISPPGLIRKDSFNNWSSDEETNLMMSKMRQFFKTMVASQSKTNPTVGARSKPPQLIHFESELTRLMKTVPGIRDEQVKEIVEYLSSEDTWSDSYDSSDYTSSDLEGGGRKSALQEEISASCRQIISNFEAAEHQEPDTVNKDTAFVYQRLVASFSRLDAPGAGSDSSASHHSPPLIAKVMQHIGSRLVALMHEVSSAEGGSPKTSRYHRRLQPKPSNTSTTEDEEDSIEDYSPLPRSKSHDPLIEENRQEASDNERFSWRGSFESALMASDSRQRLASGGEASVSASALALAAKRRSAGDLLFKTSSREQLDRVRSCGSIGGSVEDKIWGLRHQKRRRSSVPDSGGSNDGDDDSEEEAGRSTTLPRSLQGSCAATNSLPRLPTTPTSASPSIYKAHSVHQVSASKSVVSARYRPPGYSSRGSAVVPPRRDARRRAAQTPSPSNLSSPPSVVSDDASVCSESVSVRASEEEDRLTNTRASSLGARSDSLASVYSGAGEGRYGSVAVRGEVEFGLQYNYKQGALEIYVKQCRDLAAVDTKRNRSDPYVKVYLLPDKSKSGKRKTRVKKHTLNPVFEETLKFHITLEGLESRTLWLSVWHSDMFGRNDFLGEVTMALENKVFDDPLPRFYTLQERTEPLEELLSSKGELIVGLKFVPPEANHSKKGNKGCLQVLVKEAKNLTAVKSNGTSDPFCKSYLLPDKGRSSKQKTPVLRKSVSPAWHHTFSYQGITLEELASRSLELTIWDHDRLASNEFLGGVRLNLGSGKHSGKPVDWMDASGKETTLWQRMLERPNLWVESCLSLRPSLDVRNNS